MNKQLLDYIQSGQLMKFYKSREWLALRKKALERDHYECQRCKKLGKYHKAECVHHIKEVKPYPHLALTYTNLMSLCNACHNAVHDRMSEHMKQQSNKFVNEERW